MNRVTIFSTVFPSYHPRKGEATNFIEKIWSGLLNIDPQWYGQFLPGVDDDEKLFQQSYATYKSYEPKYHTIRAGHRFKVGDWIIPRVWTGKPYRSKQAEPFGDLVLPVERVWDFNIKEWRDGILASYTGYVEGKIVSMTPIIKNDGLTYNDFCQWFKLDTAKKEIHFDGQIICWNPSLRYLDTDPEVVTTPTIRADRKILNKEGR